MSRLNASGELPTFFVPKPIFDEAMDDIQEKSVTYRSNKCRLTKLTSHCHQKTYRYFNTEEPALCNQNLLEATRQAFEDRNFRVLYELIYKGLDKKDFYISAQLFEYLYAAIEIDPKITNRHEMLVNAVKGFKALNNDEEAEDFINRAHRLIKSNNEHNTEDSSDSSDNETKEEFNINIKDEEIRDED